MEIEEKKKRLEKSLDMMTETELKEICFDSFLDGLEKGMKIKYLKNSIDEEQTA